MWEMSRIRALALEQLSKSIDSVEKFALARTFDIDHWVLPALTDLVRRKESMGTAEVNRLGIDTVLKIADIRERCVLGPYGVWDIQERRGVARVDLPKTILITSGFVDDVEIFD